MELSHLKPQVSNSIFLGFQLEMSLHIPDSREQSFAFLLGHLKLGAQKGMAGNDPETGLRLVCVLRYLFCIKNSALQVLYLGRKYPGKRPQIVLAVLALT